jgi:hypothetical protein
VPHAVLLARRVAWHPRYGQRLWGSVKYEEVYLRGLWQRIRGTRIDRVLPSTFTIAADRTLTLTAPHSITPTSPRCPSAWQPNLGRRSTYRRGKTVQTTGTPLTQVAFRAGLVVPGNRWLRNHNL